MAKKESTIKYRKKARTGRHCFKCNGVRYSLVPNDVVTLPESFDLGSHLSQYEVVTPRKPVRKKSPKQEPPQKVLEVVEVEGGFNVINKDNPEKPLNDEPLPKEEAEELAGLLTETKEN